MFLKQNLNDEFEHEKVFLLKVNKSETPSGIIVLNNCSFKF